MLGSESNQQMADALSACRVGLGPAALLSSAGPSGRKPDSGNSDRVGWLLHDLP